MADRAVPGLCARGGGARDLEVRTLGQPSDAMIVVHVIVDCRDAMGANLINHHRGGGPPIASRASPAGGSGSASSRTSVTSAASACAAASSADVLATPDMDGQAVIDGIVNASRFAELDPYRAATHNKGIMNGVDAVVIATGNDLARGRGWRSRVRRALRAVLAALHLAPRRRRARGVPRDAARAGDGGRNAPRAPERAPLATDRERAVVGRARGDGRGGRPRVEPRRSPGAGHGRHPARSHGLARPLRGARRRRRRRRGRRRCGHHRGGARHHRRGRPRRALGAARSDAAQERRRRGPASHGTTKPRRSKGSGLLLRPGPSAGAAAAGSAAAASRGYGFTLLLSMFAICCSCGVRSSPLRVS